MLAEIGLSKEAKSQLAHDPSLLDCPCDSNRTKDRETSIQSIARARFVARGAGYSLFLG